MLLPGFGLGALAGATDVLQAANALLAETGEAPRFGPAYTTVLLGGEVPPDRVSGECRVASASGAQLLARPLAEAGALDALFVVAERPFSAVPGSAPSAARAELLALLLQLAAAGRLLGGIGTGAAWLAEAGLLRGHRATVHWPQIGPLAERHPEVLVSQRVWEIDRGRLTCAGHQASRDLLIGWLGQRHGERFAQELAAQFGLAHVPAADERQHAPLGARLAAQQGGGSAKLAEAVALMEANLAEPLPTEEIARLVGVSRRQLERLFRQHLDALPSRWYLGLRLALAQRLLRQTSQSVLQIALGCGFASGPHFSNAYRGFYGRTPRDERSPRAAAWRAEGQPPQTANSPPATDDHALARDTAQPDDPT
ncbi:helix-turn-helix domain-containing protein [Ideonella sp. DXS22W]|uniref:Helix-turn-helix domain-containing protein n=1 Tax=Pseudaquabacterium inlustre TaxID=2984192 RepID=A0ABU9CJ70_9BURK